MAFTNFMCKNMFFFFSNFCRHPRNYFSRQHLYTSMYIILLSSADIIFYLMYKWILIGTQLHFLLYVMQHIKREGGLALQVKSILSFVISVLMLELFLSFKMTPYLLKPIKAFKFYNWERIRNSCLLYYFLDVFIYI